MSMKNHSLSKILKFVANLVVNSSSCRSKISDFFHFSAIMFYKGHFYVLIMLNDRNILVPKPANQVSVVKNRG